MQLWASEVGSNYELVYIVTIIPAIYVISCKITVLGFIFFFLYQKLSLFTGTIYPTHILFHLHFHNSFKHPHFIHFSRCFQCLFSSLQFMTTATFGTSPFTYCFPNHSDHLHMLPMAVPGNLECVLNPSIQRILLCVLYVFLFSYFTCFCGTHISLCSLAKIFSPLKCTNLVRP